MRKKLHEGERIWNGKNLKVDKAWGKCQGAGSYIIKFGLNVGYMKGVKQYAKCLEFSEGNN